MTPKYCSLCGRRQVATTSTRGWCRACETYVPCLQCGLRRGAPPELLVCERCRRLNAIHLREFFAAVLTIARLDPTELAGRPVYPYRTPLTNIDAARLARAARPLVAAVLELAVLEELRAAKRKGPKRAERAQEVARWKKRR